MTDPTTTLLAYIPSPPQGVWYLGSFPIRAYALCIIVGIVVAVWWGTRRWISRGGQPGEVLDIAIWAVPFGLVGGRIYHLITDWRIYFGGGGKDPIDALKIWDGGLGIWGAVILGGVGAWIGARRHGIRLPAFGDAIAPPILFAQAIGRLGNYFNQELYGRPTKVPWGLEIFQRTDGVHTDPALISGHSTGEVYSVVQPTFLYELVWNVIVVLALVLVDRRLRIGHGRLFALYVAGYCAGRFAVELLRSDPAYTHIAGVRINVFVAALLFVGAAIYFVVATKGRERGLEMYYPWRAEELADLGERGYVDRRGIDDDESDTGAGTDRDETRHGHRGAAVAAGAGTLGAAGAATAVLDDDQPTTELPATGDERDEDNPHPDDLDDSGGDDGGSEDESRDAEGGDDRTDDTAETEEFAAVGAERTDSQAGVSDDDAEDISAGTEPADERGDELEDAAEPADHEDSVEDEDTSHEADEDTGHEADEDTGHEADDEPVNEPDEPDSVADEPAEDDAAAEQDADEADEAGEDVTPASESEQGSEDDATGAEQDADTADGADADIAGSDTSDEADNDAVWQTPTDADISDADVSDDDIANTDADTSEDRIESTASDSDDADEHPTVQDGDEPTSQG